MMHPPRRIPAAVRDRLKATLDEMEKIEVIRNIDESAKWVNSMVTVEKPNSNKLRIWLDPKDIFLQHIWWGQRSFQIMPIGNKSLMKKVSY